MSAVTVYTRENCYQCKLTYADLDKKGIDYELVDLDKNPDIFTRLKSEGHRALPVVVSPIGTWAGLRFDMLNQLQMACKAGV